MNEPLIRNWINNTGFPDSKSADVAESSQSGFAISNRLVAGLTSGKTCVYTYVSYLRILWKLQAI